MKLLKKYNDTFSLDVDYSTEKVVNTFVALANSPKKPFIVDKLFYGETYTYIDNTFEIQRSQALFDAFKGVGQIKMKPVSINDTNRSKIIFETIPYQSENEYGLIFILGFLILFSIASLLISTNFNTILIIILGWTVIPLTIHLWLIWTKAKLRKYSLYFIKKVIR